ncbi:TPA: hypothetical protein ACF3H5_002294 [Enterococcus faecium]
MSYSKLIGEKLLDIIKEAPTGTSTHYLKEFDQKDVMDTVNFYHGKYPENILLSEMYYDNFAPIVINK